MSIITSFQFQIPRVLLLACLSFLFFPGWTAGPAVFEPQRTAADTRPEVALKDARRKMIEQDIAGRGIRDKRVLQVMGTLPRHWFVPEDARSWAYEDRPLPIGSGQTISQPYIVALMTELLELKGPERVLEIGTGSGYQTAVLAGLAAEVFSVEILADLSATAEKVLERLNIGNVSLKIEDGFYGWEEQSPFDAILVTAAATNIPEPLWNQLREGGRLVMPLGKEGQMQRLIRVRKTDGRRMIEEVSDVLFVPLTGGTRKAPR